MKRYTKCCPLNEFCIFKCRLEEKGIIKSTSRRHYVCLLKVSDDNDVCRLNDDIDICRLYNFSHFGYFFIQVVKNLNTRVIIFRGYVTDNCILVNFCILI